MTKVAKIGWGNANGVAVKKTVRPNPTGSNSDKSAPSASRAVPIGHRVSPEEYHKTKEAAKHGIPLGSKTQRDT